MRFLSDKMVYRLIGYFLLISLPTIALATGFSYLLARKALERSVFDRLEGTVEDKTQELVNWIETQRREILFIADNGQIRAQAGYLLDPQGDDESARRAQALLNESLSRMLRNKPDLQTIFFMSLEDGRVVLSTDPSMEGEYRIGDGFYTHGRYTTYLQNVYLSPDTMEPAMTLATPLTDGLGRRIGVVAVGLDLARMDRIILGSTILGRTGQAYLVDRVNEFISAPRLARREFRRGVHSPGIEAALKGESGIGPYRNYQGVPVLGAYRWIEELDLALLAEISQEEAYAPAMRLVWLIAGLSSALALVLGLGMFLLARRIAQPILAISRAASQVASGDLAARAPILTRDEVGDLARSFNQMAQRLGLLYQGLEEKVAQLEQVESALRESERYYRDFFENDLTGDFVADPRGSIRSYNPALAEILGLDPAGEPEPPNLARFFSGGETWAEFLAALSREGRLDYHQMVMRRTCGRTVMVVANFIAERNPAGEIREIKGYLFDDTKRLELEEQLRHSQKMEALGRLAGGVAHDFNNLMTAVTGYSDLALAKLEKGHPLRAGIEQIAKAGERAASLTRQLLVFSRRQVLQTKVVDLNAIVAETEKMVRRLVGEDIEILTNLDPELGPVEADEGQIQQVIMNLVINARDAMPEGGLLTIETKNNRSGNFPDLGDGSGGPGFVRVSVSDTGVGMDQETQSRVFDPFFTTKEQGKGTGLGLATVHGVVEQSGGRVIIDSEPGCGTSFHVILPRSQGRAESGAARTDPPRTAANQETILLVEDEEAVREMTTEVLKLSGYRVVAAPDGQEALEIFGRQGESVDLVVTDVVMPGLSGPDLVRHLRRIRPGLKVLYISGYTDKELWAGQLEEEGTAFMPKPFRPAELAAAIRELLEPKTEPGPDRGSDRGEEG